MCIRDSTKSDKDGADVDAALTALRAFQVPVLALNAKDPAAAEALARWLGAGQSIVLVGSSGAGKSTLSNTLLGVEKMKTGAVRASDARGRHTTTHRALLALASGACLIDTPGTVSYTHLCDPCCRSDARQDSPATGSP